MEYKQVKKGKIYRLINTGPLMLVSTLSKEKKPDIAPIAWACPAELDPARVLICLDKGHKTFKNLKETGVFAVSIPHASQIDLVEETGSVSGKQGDKYSLFSIKAFTGKKTKCLIPRGVIGYIECKVRKIFNVEGTMTVIGDAVYAAAMPGAFDGERLLSEKPAGKALHHLGKDRFTTYCNYVIK